MGHVPKGVGDFILLLESLQLGVDGSFPLAVIYLETKSSSNNDHVAGQLPNFLSCA
jgi:hypothetical protein